MKPGAFSVRFGPYSVKQKRISRRQSPAAAVGGIGKGQRGEHPQRSKNACASPRSRGRQGPCFDDWSCSSAAVAGPVSGCHVVRGLSEIGCDGQRHDVIEGIGTRLTAQPADVGRLEHSGSEVAPLSCGSTSTGHRSPPYAQVTGRWAHRSLLAATVASSFRQLQRSLVGIAIAAVTIVTTSRCEVADLGEPCSPSMRPQGALDVRVAVGGAPPVLIARHAQAGP